MNTTITYVKNLQPWERRVLQVISKEDDVHYDWEYEEWDSEVDNYYLEVIQDINQLLLNDMTVSENRNKLFSFLTDELWMFTDKMFPILEPQFISRGFFNIKEFALEYPYIFRPVTPTEYISTEPYSDMEFVITNFSALTDSNCFATVFGLLLQNIGLEKAIANKPYEMLALLKQWISEVIDFGDYFFDIEGNEEFECKVPEELKTDYAQIFSVIKEEL